MTFLIFRGSQFNHMIFIDVPIWLMEYFLTGYLQLLLTELRRIPLITRPTDETSTPITKPTKITYWFPALTRMPAMRLTIPKP